MHLPPIRQLQYLVALKDQLHFGQAALELNVAQSTLSTGIRENTTANLIDELLDNNLDMYLLEAPGQS